MNQQSSPMLDAPYKGLMPYAEEDAPFFFGREPEREIITANLMAWRLTLIWRSWTPPAGPLGPEDAESNSAPSRVGLLPPCDDLLRKPGTNLGDQNCITALIRSDAPGMVRAGITPMLWS